jgi:hypothetical protein
MPDLLHQFDQKFLFIFEIEIDGTSRYFCQVSYFFNARLIVAFTAKKLFRRFQDGITAIFLFPETPHRPSRHGIIRFIYPSHSVHLV